MQKIQTSKLFLVLITGASLCVTIIYLRLICTTEREMSDFTTVVCAVWAAWATYCGFYQWKAKCENKAKYAQKFINTMADKYGIEIIAPIVQSIIED